MGAGPPSSALKKKLDIEDLLRWAYLDELPKSAEPPNAWDRLAQYGFLGGVDVDVSIQRYAPHIGEPHADAKAIAAAVTALGKISIEQDFDIVVGELHALVSVNDLKPRPRIALAGKAVEGGGYYEKDAAPPNVRPRDVLFVSTINVSALVVTHAVLGTRPQWKAGTPRPTQIPGRRGPMIVGECRGRNLYTTGSYCPLRYLPSPVEIVLGRADYHLWHRALVSLAQTLNLKEHIALAPSAPAAPWLAEQKKRRVWSYAVAKQRPLPLKPQRERAGPPLRKSRKNKDNDDPFDKGAKA